MKLNDYRSYMEKLDTAPQMDERILEYVYEKRQKKMTIKVARAVVCAMALLLMTVPIKAVAAAMVNYFSEMFGNAEGGAAFSPTYSYENEHVRMQVEQMLSDGRNVHLIYSYELLDERGKKWYEDYFINHYRESVELVPKFRDDNNVKYPVNYSVRHTTAKEAGLAQYETETKKYAMVYAAMSSNRWGTDEVKFQFPVPGKGVLVETVLPLETSVKSQVYTIDGKEKEEKGYIPARVTLSAFGVQIEAKWQWETKNKAYSDEEWQAWEADNLSLVFADGTMWDLFDFEFVDGGYFGGGPGQYTEEQKNDEIDGYIYASYFTEQIDMSDVIGIYIDDNYYALDMQEGK